MDSGSSCFHGVTFVPFADTFPTQTADCTAAATAWVWETISHWGFASFSLLPAWQWCMRRLLWGVLASSLSPLTQPLLLALSQLTEDHSRAEDFVLVTAVSLWYSALSGIIEPYFLMVASRHSFNFLVNKYSIFCLDGYIHEV